MAACERGRQRMLVGQVAIPADRLRKAVRVVEVRVVLLVQDARGVLSHAGRERWNTVSEGTW